MRRVSPTRARADAYAPFAPNSRELASVMRAASAGRALRCASTSWDGSVWAASTQCSTPPLLLKHGADVNRTTPREVALLFAPTFPNELFWKVATYWNPRYEALTPNN